MAAVRTSPTFTASSASTRTSRKILVGSAPAFLKCPASGLEIRCAFCAPNPICAASYPSVAIVLRCTTVQGPTWTTVTGTWTPFSSYTRVMPIFLPINVCMVILL